VKTKKTRRSTFWKPFHTNRAVADLTIRQIYNLEGTALGNLLCGLVQKHTPVTPASLASFVPCTREESVHFNPHYEERIER
jgi:hypothetical protein